MIKDGLMTMRYLVSAEESRIGMQDYWNNVFLASRTPFTRACLEALKVLFVLTLSTFAMMALSGL